MTAYTFDILGISEPLYLFDRQQSAHVGVEYVGTPTCTLDAMLRSANAISLSEIWDKEQMASEIVQFWLKNPEPISFWKAQLDRAGETYLLVSRVANLNVLRGTFDRLFDAC